MILNQIVLFSNDINVLSHFLSDLFDLETESHSDSATLYNDHLKFLVVPISEGQIIGNDTLIDLRVDNDNDLNDLKQKVEFLNYRIETAVDGKLSVQLSSSEIKEVGTSKFFFFNDTDQRKWKISTSNIINN